MKSLLLVFALVFSFFSFSQIPNYVPSNGLVGYWPFTGNANDLSGNNNNNGIVKNHFKKKTYYKYV